MYGLIVPQLAVDPRNTLNQRERPAREHACHTTNADKGSSLTGGERLRSPPVNEQLHEALDPLENFRDVDSL